MNSIHTTKQNNLLLVVTLIVCLLAGCRSAGEKNRNEMEKSFEKGEFGYDVNFLKKHNIETVELRDSLTGASILIAPGLQGRVMTSTSDGPEGLSYGWINYRFIEAGQASSQFNPFGGEERLWLGPEGGPFSIYFPEGADQVFTNWKVPEILDTLPFDITNANSRNAGFRKEFSLINASGTGLEIEIERSIRLLGRDETGNAIGVPIGDSLSFVAYESRNTLGNKGLNEWTREKGFLSVWMLAMFNPSEEGVVFIPYREDAEGAVVNDDYFGKVPAERLITREGTIFFRTDGKYRSKIGVGPARALPFCGSYDPVKGVLTILWYSPPGSHPGYVNSKWGVQDDPLSGDVVNSYNDGPVEDGSVMGPFYEIESSSPAALLKPGETISHTQRIFHFRGKKEELDKITVKLFGLTTSQIEEVF